MFSSLNNLKISELKPTDSEDMEKIMLFRCPYKRTISCFLNWMINVPKQNNIFKINKKELLSCQTVDDENKMCGWLIPLLLRETDFNLNNYKILLAQNNLIELFKIYINALPKIKSKNPHTESQVEIVKRNKFKINTFINIDSKSDLENFKQKIKQDIPIVNKSKNEDKEICENFINNNTDYKNIIYMVYKNDFEFLPI